MPDDALRASCFASLDVLCATHGEDVPYPGGLEVGFVLLGGLDSPAPKIAISMLLLMSSGFPGRSILRADCESANSSFRVKELIQS